MELDATDWKILDLMQADARLSNVELARQIGLSPSPCLTRVRALEKGGYIRRYVTLLDSLRVGLRVSVFIQVTLERQIEPALESTPVGQGGNAAAAGGRLPEVSSAAALRRLRVGLDVDVGVDSELGLEVDVGVDEEVDVDVEHEVGADCAQATPDSPRRNSSAAATSMVAKTIQLREKPAMITSRTGCRWDLRSSPA